MNDLEWENQRLRAALELIQDGRWNFRRPQRLTVHEFARVVLAPPPDPQPAEPLDEPMLYREFTPDERAAIRRHLETE